MYNQAVDNYVNAPEYVTECSKTHKNNTYKLNNANKKQLNRNLDDSH